MNEWEMEGDRQVFFLGKPERMHPLSGLKISWEDNIIWDVKEVDYEGDFKALSQDKVTWRAMAAMNLRVP